MGSTDQDNLEIKKVRENKRNQRYKESFRNWRTT